MQIFEQIKVVSKTDLDALNHVNNVRYVQWVQDIAEKHWLTKATNDILRHFFWVMLSHHIEYKQAAFLNDVITIKTFVSKSEGVTSIRIVEFYKDNLLLAKSETTWCFMNKSSLKPNRISEEVQKLFE